MTTPHGLGYVKMVIMVDEDVDPFNLPQVMWALSSKVNPAGDLVQLPNMSVLELDPGSSPAGITDKLIIDATTPVTGHPATIASRFRIFPKPKPGLKN
jgi:UbiD family decarboxylase